jgi:phage head maturation protease
MKLIRSIHPEIRVVDAKAGLVEYIASDESLDSYREVIRAAGWRFTHFQKNAPFVDSHDYSSIEKLVGKVVDFTVDKKRLVETVQWAIDIADNKLAQRGFAMTQGGYLKAVSVGFWPVKAANRWDADRTGYDQQLSELGLTTAPDAQKPRTIYQEQEQIELSAVIIGANPNALAKAYKAGVIDDAALEDFAREHERRENARAAARPDHAARARGQARERFLVGLHTIINQL